MLRLTIPFIALVALSSEVLAAEPRVSFNRDIRPIMSDTCFHCHGNDPKSRKAGMRLDLREEALKKTKHDLLPIVPGKPDESEIIFRIFDESDPMPPEEAHKTLTAAQKDLFRRWVAEGAVYEPHWAYAPLAKPALPAATRAEANPIDAFIREKLTAKKIAPSPEADKFRLLRRVSLDLTGLPPTPKETAVFLADRSRDAYEKKVERLLASPRHGERMAVWWLDLARFTDTVGFHGDQNQRIFPYRDYVINAFNTNKRFDQFTIEQLAGDLLPNATTEQRVATGYNRLNMMTREGGAQPQEYLAKYGAERVRGVAAAWFGSTFGCAECHDHKFDPIKTRDFYELQSFFADVKQWGVYSDYGYTRNPELAGFNNDFPFPPEIEVASPYLTARHDRAAEDLNAHVLALRRHAAEPAAAARFATWLDEIRAHLARVPGAWERPLPASEVVKAGKPVMERAVAVEDDGTVRLARALVRTETLRLALRPGTASIAALRVDLVAEPVADPEKRRARAGDTFTLAASVRGADGKDRKLAFAFADAAAKAPRYRGGFEIEGIAAGWRLPTDRAGDTLTAVWLLTEPLTLAPDETLVVSITGEARAPFRVATSPLGAGRPLDVASDAVLAALATPQTGAAQQALLADTWLMSTGDDRSGFTRYHELTAAIRATNEGKAWSMVTEAVEPFTVRVLPRGNWQDESGAVVLPATPSFLPGRRESTLEKRLTRLDLARWIVSRDNPITARTVVNRLWAIYFGTALSASVDDLGSQGELPSHPELLDWLASEFRDGGWDLRHMIRLIVTSGTYRQISTARPELRETDPANRLLASQNPRRLEAEFVRDNALFIAGLLDLRDLGGPSAFPYQPPGYYAALQFPDRDYISSDADAQWRRGVYMHWQRTFLHPMLANFDAPARDECAAARSVSNTPQQALTLLNDPTFVEAARHFAARVLAAGGQDDPPHVRAAFQLALARAPKAAEQKSLTAFLATQRDYYRANVPEAEKLLRIGISPPPTGDAAELAAWTMVARVLLNSQEVITRY
ncbi:MAG: PSD1 and planctomycete cytochrome C domain-containing protein [Opitutaceae bacterium]